MKIVKVSQITLYPLPLNPSRQGRDDMLLPSPSMGEGQVDKTLRGEGVDSFSEVAACPQVSEKTRDSTET
jgi:hypothetical protein